jgi:DNA-directed RNA polymerase specialized sigma24 family protein
MTDSSLEALPDVQVDARRLLAILDGLPEEERRCSWLRRGEGLRIHEIAKETALSVSTIQRRLHATSGTPSRRERCASPSVGSSNGCWASAWRFTDRKPSNA